MQLWPVATSVDIWIIASIPDLFLSKCRPDLWAWLNITHNQTESFNAKCDSVCYICFLSGRLFKYHPVEVKLSQSPRKFCPKGPYRSPSLKSFLCCIVIRFSVNMWRLDVFNLIPFSCLMSPGDPAASMKAMCILSLPAQLLKPERKLENISPNYTVFHHFFLTPQDNWLAHCLSLFSIALLGVWALNEVTQGT